MQRTFINENSLSGVTIVISGKDQVHHLKSVLRLKPGDKIIAVDGKKNEYNCTVSTVGAKVIELNIVEQVSIRKKSSLKITIACALPKKSKFDDIVERLTQLGVARIIPMKTERVVVHLDQAKEQARIARWKKIALNAAEQSQRSDVPLISRLETLDEVLSESGYDLKLIPALIDERKSLKEVLVGKNLKNILVLIGPEGDFSPSELRQAKEAGFVPVTLGELVLRVETAAVAAASFIMLNA